MATTRTDKTTIVVTPQQRELGEQIKHVMICLGHDALCREAWGWMITYCANCGADVFIDNKDRDIEYFRNRVKVGSVNLTYDSMRRAFMPCAG